MITKIEGFKYIRRKTKKTQIVLCNTLRPYNFYINSLRYRNNGDYNKIPHLVINKKGEVFSLIPTDYSSDLLNNKSAINISLENLGWLQKSMLAPMYVNWIGDVYRGEPYCGKWKDRFFWDVYTPEQLAKLKEIINALSEKYSISKNIIEHREQINNPNKFKGILFRSNFSNLYTDVSPAFDKNHFTQILMNSV